MILTHRFFYVLIVLAFATGTASAQGPATGTPPFGSFGGGPEIINLANLNIHWGYPFLHKPGRGTNFTYDMSYDTSIWYPSAATGTTTWTPATNWGWRGTTETLTGYISYRVGRRMCVFNSQLEYWYIYSNWTYHDP